MASDQEILKARTFRVADAIRGSEASAKDADWYRTRMNMFLNAHRYSRGSLTPVQIYPSPGQEFLEYLTPWEKEWSVLARSYAGGFTPIVDEKGTLVAHRGVTGTTDSTPLIAPYGDLLYTLPEQTLSQSRVDSNLKKISDWRVNNNDLLQLLKDGANVFVQSRKKALPPDWRWLSYFPAETKLNLMVSVDGELFDFAQSNTGFLQEGYSPAVALGIGQILTTLGAKIGTKIVTAIVRQVATRAEARLLLSGPTKDVLNLSVARTAGKTSTSTTGSASAILPGEVHHMGRRTLIMGDDMAAVRSGMAHSHSESGFFDVIIHGNETSFVIYLWRKGKWVPKEVSAREVANVVRSQLQPGDKIRLLSCSTGNTGGPAQQLADELGHTVWGSTTKVPVKPKIDASGTRTSFVPLDKGKFHEFVPSRGMATLAGNGGKSSGNEVQGVIQAIDKK